jgi:hypothetical protein
MISFTIDAWTSKNTLPFLGISFHWIDDNWNLCSSTLDFCLLPGSHTGENLANKFLEVLDDFDISTKVFSLSIFFYLFYKDNNHIFFII